MDNMTLRCLYFEATGACLCIRSKAFHDLGGFDADFFAHQEEIDLCWRLQNKGHGVWVEPKSMVYHVGGGTLNSDHSFKTYLNFRNNLFMLYKNLKNPWRKICIRLVLDGIAGVHFLTKENSNIAGLSLRHILHFMLL